MGTVPQMQPTNNQTAGTTTSPMTSRISGSPLAATVPIASAPTGTLTGAGSSTANQPFGTVAPSVGTDAGLTVPATGIGSGLSTVGGDDTVLGDFQATYGQGTGTALEGVLAGLGTATSGAVTATNQGIIDSAQKQYANLQATQAAQGVSADSSTAALAAGDFNAQVNQGIASTDAGIELSEENALINSLQNEGSKLMGRMRALLIASSVLCRLYPISLALELMPWIKELPLGHGWYNFRFHS